jgi:hypothetical protein
MAKKFALEFIQWQKIIALEFIQWQNLLLDLFYKQKKLFRLFSGFLRK